MAHIHTARGDFDYTASAYIVNDNKILLLMHHKLHMWLPPAGHVEVDETPIAAVYREVEEEVGLSRHNLTFIPTDTSYRDIERDEEQQGIPLPFDLELHPISDDHSHIDFAYVFTSDTDIVTPEPDGATDLRWYTLDEIATLMPMPRSIYSRCKLALNYSRQASRD